MEALIDVLSIYALWWPKGSPRKLIDKYIYIGKYISKWIY